MTNLVWAGVDALKDYIALHVLTCLVPAFLLAGAMVTFPIWKHPTAKREGVRQVSIG